MKKTITLLLIILSLSVSAQSQITWGAGTNIAASASGNNHPRVVTDAAGNPLVIWGNANRAMFSRWNGTAFTTPVMLNPMTMTIAEESWMGPDIAAHGDTVYVVFKQTPEADTSSHIFIVRSFDGGATFSLPVKVDSPIDTVSRFSTVTTDTLGNPIVAFMNFNSGFSNAQWAVAKSTDFGSTFSTSVRASGWSSVTSTVCDCCPGGVVNSGSNVAVVYRDNNSNIRDSWAGLSTNGGNSFSGGWNMDQNNWFLMSCPATGPDGVIIGDSLYSVFMNGVSGNRVYKSVSSISGMSAQPSEMIAGSIPGLTQQNYPRIDRYGNAMAIVWRQFVSSVEQLPVYFTSDISTGFPAAYDTVDLGNIVNTDVAVANGKIFVVWEDDNSGTVKYRSGTFAPVITAVKEIAENDFSVYPNPATKEFRIQDSGLRIQAVEIYDVLGQRVLQSQIRNLKSEISVDVSTLSPGIYFVRVNPDASGEKGEYSKVSRVVVMREK
ncbi:MAG TPA: T9SS type A sorting domain-containing protein [Bacteroidia bacterium]|nr:T9SS type A sorting domain-containing protein [Bacteroidia bacterium]